MAFKQLPLWLGVLFLVPTSIIADEFSSFENEAARFKVAYACPKAKITPAEDGFGALFGCIAGKAETAKYFINEIPGTGRIENIKVMWNDWFKDIGYGLHADSVEAEEMVKTAAHLYAPLQQENLISIFRLNANKEIKANGFTFAYTYTRGPKIDERLITITQD